MKLPFKIASCLLLLIGLFKALQALIAHGFGPGGDFDQDYCAATALRNGESIYTAVTGICETLRHPEIPVHNFHPPLHAILFTPLTFLSLQNAFILFGIGTLLLFSSLFWRGWKEILSDTRFAPYALLFFAPAIFWTPFLIQVVDGQSSILIAALLFFGWIYFKKKEFGRAGALIGASTSLKFFPALLLILFIRRNTRSGFFTGVATFLIFQLLSLAVVGPGDYLHYFRVVMSEDVQRFKSFPLNQSLFSIAPSLFLPTAFFKPLVQSVIAAPALNALLLGIGCGAVYLLLNRFKDRSDMQYWGMTLLSVILSPIAWHHSFLIITPLLLICFKEERGEIQRLAALLLIVSLQFDLIQYARSVLELHPFLSFMDLVVLKLPLLATLIFLTLLLFNNPKKES